MSLEFIGSALPRRESELIPPIGPPVQPEFVSRLARDYEDSPFDSVQIGQTATSVDAVVLAQAVLSATERLAVVVTVPATVIDALPAARAVASLAAMHPGRVRVRIPVAADEPSRHAELAQVLRGLWHSSDRFDHVGQNVAASDGWLAVRPDPAPQLYLPAGQHPQTHETVAVLADTCFVAASSPSEVAARIRRMREFAGRLPLRFGIDIRPVVGVDDDAVEALSRSIIRVAPTWTFGERALSRDERRRALAVMTRADGSAAPFVGTVDAIAHRVHEYSAVGVDVFRLSGFDPLADVNTLSSVVDVVRRLADADTHRSAVVHHVA